MAKVKVKPRSWKYRNAVAWTEARMGVLSSQDRPDIDVATPAEFGGHEGIWTPEDLFVASLNICVMTTFLHYSEKMNVALASYRAEAEGTMEQVDGHLKFTRMIVRPQVVVTSEADCRKAERVLHLSAENCLISNSMDAEVVLEAHVECAHGQD